MMAGVELRVDNSETDGGIGVMGSPDAVPERFMEPGNPVIDNSSPPPARIVALALSNVAQSVSSTF